MEHVSPVLCCSSSSSSSSSCLPNKPCPRAVGVFGCCRAAARCSAQGTTAGAQQPSVLPLAPLVQAGSQPEVESLYKRFRSLDRARKGYISAEELMSIPELSINPLAQRLVRSLRVCACADCSSQCCCCGGEKQLLCSLWGGPAGPPWLASATWERAAAGAVSTYISFAQPRGCWRVTKHQETTHAPDALDSCPLVVLAAPCCHRCCHVPAAGRSGCLSL
jgi:hypothetical protein